MWILFGEKLKFFIESLELYKNENTSLKAENSFLINALNSEREERINLSNIILKHTGFLPTKPESDNKEINFKPVGNNSSWRAKRVQLEMESEKRAKLKNNIVRPMNKEELDEIDNIIKKEENASQGH